jgi:hypothetical protein
MTLAIIAAIKPLISKLASVYVANITPPTMGTRDAQMRGSEGGVLNTTCSITTVKNGTEL